MLNLMVYCVTGGKWTTYRHMAEETVDRCIEVCQLSPLSPCQTTGLLLDGAHGWSPTLFIRLIQDFGVDSAVCFFTIKLKILSVCVVKCKRQWTVPLSTEYCCQFFVRASIFLLTLKNPWMKTGFYFVLL